MKEYNRLGAKSLSRPPTTPAPALPLVGRSFLVEVIVHMPPDSQPLAEHIDGDGCQGKGHLNAANGAEHFLRPCAD